MDLVSTTVILVVLLAISVWLRHRHARTAYPPGPSGLPIIGNVHQLPLISQELKFLEWSRIYGRFLVVSCLLVLIPPLNRRSHVHPIISNSRTRGQLGRDRK